MMGSVGQICATDHFLRSNAILELTEDQVWQRIWLARHDGRKITVKSSEGRRFPCSPKLDRTRLHSARRSFICQVVG